MDEMDMELPTESRTYRKRKATPLERESAKKLKFEEPIQDANSPKISVRHSIKWGNSPAQEDIKIDVGDSNTRGTRNQNLSIITLTSPENIFIDTRIYLPRFSDTVQMPIERLSWAFAGMVFSTPAGEGKPASSEWSHWIDSNFITSEYMDQAGDVFYRYDGSSLSYGRMEHPDTCFDTDFVEEWRPMKPTGHKIGWVLKCEEPPEIVGRGDIRGLVIRIGDMMHGIRRIDDDLNVARWELQPKDTYAYAKDIDPNKGGGGWVKTVEFGDLNVWQGDDTMEWAGRMEKGQIFELFGTTMEKVKGMRWEESAAKIKWTCIESFEWV